MELFLSIVKSICMSSSIQKGLQLPGSFQEWEKLNSTGSSKD